MLGLIIQFGVFAWLFWWSLKVLYYALRVPPDLPELSNGGHDEDEDFLKVRGEGENDRVGERRWQEPTRRIRNHEERERRAMEREERERRAMEREERERRAMEREERERPAMEREERERRAMEREERERRAMEREERERRAMEREERERRAMEREERERRAMESEERERPAMEREERERRAVESEERERRAMEREERERRPMEREERERRPMEREERERPAMEREERERPAMEREERERPAMEREERERRAVESEERERLAVEEGRRQSLIQERQRRQEDKRRQLMCYKFGDKIHLASFRGLVLDDVTDIRLVMFGPAGSGKSCFINTCTKVVLHEPRGPAPLSSTSSEGTTILEDYFKEMPLIRLVDTRGQDHINEFEIQEMRKIICGIIKSGDFISRDASHPQGYEVGEDIPFGSLVHGVLFIFKATEVLLRNGVLERNLERFRKEDLQRQGMTPVTVVTHQDKLREEEFEEIKKRASAATGSSLHCTFLLTNYCDENPDGNSGTVSTTLDILHAALTVAEKYVKTRKRRLKSNQIDAVRVALGRYNEPGGPSEIVRNASLTVMFRDVLQQKHEWSNGEVDQVLEVLEVEDVITILALSTCWEDVKPTLVDRCGDKMVEIIKRYLDTLNIES